MQTKRMYQIMQLFMSLCTLKAMRKLSEKPLTHSAPCASDWVPRWKPEHVAWPCRLQSSWWEYQRLSCTGSRAMSGFLATLCDSRSGL